MKYRLKNLLIALDQFLFCWLTLGRANPDETLSAAAWRWEVQGKWQGILRPVIDTVLFFDKEHCFNSYVSEVNSKQLPAFYRQS